jgi:hypothetical protein
MLRKSKIEAIADIIVDHITISGINEFFAQACISNEDFVPIEPSDFKGETIAVDGSNAVVCDWSVANLNMIRAGYAVYRGTEWQKTVITYDDIFLADPKAYTSQFNLYLNRLFGLENLALEDTELERLSSYFRELQEYIALFDAVCKANPHDLVLYDGGFALWKSQPLGGVLKEIFKSAEERNVDLLGISKSSSFYWGEAISKPFVQHVSYSGSQIAPGIPWYLSLRGKSVEPNTEIWDGTIYVVRFDGRSDCAFRVDAPSFVAEHISDVLSKLIAHSCSAECLGYPHALFRAHRDIRITKHETESLKMDLLDLLGERGMAESQIRSLLMDYHDILEMRSGRVF